MFHSRQTAPRFLSPFAALLITGTWFGLAAAQSDTTSGDQWRPAGITSSAGPQSAAASDSNTEWRLPNGQSNTGDTQLVDEDSNPLRETRKPQPAAIPPEPRSFQAPANATPISAATSKKALPANQQRTVTTVAATQPVTKSTQARVAQQPPSNRAPANTKRPFVQPNNRPAARNQNLANSPGENLWASINVAFQGPPANTKALPAPQKSVVKNRSEDLPMPGEGGYEMNDPVMRYPGGPGEFADRLGGPAYHPYGEQGNCCGDDCQMGCAGPCCGDNCDPGCGCEPGCDCPSGNCQKDVFCIGPGDDESCHIVQVRWPKWQEVVLFGGVQGFKSPYDRDRDSGNFGFNEGFNIGAKIPYALLGYQFGYRATQSQLNGDKDTNITDQFVQSFVTAGIFHRSMEGLQFGIVWDGLVDERESKNYHQIRSEFSVINCNCHEFGFGATVGVNSHKLEDPAHQGTELDYQASDQYVLFYRMHGCRGGEGKVYAGINNDSDGIFGADTLVPIGGSFSLQSGFTYLIPHQGNGTAGATNEAWNVGLGLVWHWDGQARKCYENCYRPMFNVADNGTLIVDQPDRNN